ncbi:N-acetylmuramoyl-L-alanine amidase [Natronosalvus amylolyticus]|uniref:N-acetylmuramoyl-L-alanine amidase n=1 Tax=Natronosalvus amylolyticus TaxID=2961994 RepID=UPI0020CA003E|nr:N-acetylmuramoyl-L-alanine amidase [Natronosalvus amylolyticus]
MEIPRRKLLQSAGASLGAGVGLGTATTTASAASDPTDRWLPAHSSNYSASNRTKSDINWIVIHYTVGSYAGAINWFRNSSANVSAHYVIRNSDGHTTKMVDESDVAWHASGFNSNSIGIEHEWVEGQNGFSDALYSRSAQLIEFLAEKYDIPKNYYTSHTAPCDADGGIIGHMHAPTNSWCSSSNSTSCPGPYDPDRLMAHLEGDGGDDPEGPFELEQPVRTTSTLDVYEAPRTDSSVVATVDANSAARVINGPEAGDKYRWWGLHFVSEGIWAWAGEPWLEGCPGFCHGTVVTPTSTTNVRSGPSTWYNVRTSVETDAVGTVTQGPQTNDHDDYTWWHVEWNDGSEGWSAEGLLEVSTTGESGERETDTEARFEPGERVYTTDVVTARSEPTVGDNVIHTQPADVYGQVSDGPVDADGFRWWRVEYNNDVDGWSPDRYLASGGDYEPPFSIGDELRATTTLNVRADGSLEADIVGTVDETTTGTVTNGIVTRDGYIWWEIEWETGLRGWSVERYLEAASDRRAPLPFDVETDLTEPVEVTGAELNAAIEAERPDSPLIGLGNTFVAVQNEYGINAIYQLAHAIHESAWGTSDIAQDHNNLFGYGAEDDCPYECAERYDSFEDCVWAVMDDVYELYLTPGNWRYNGPTLEGMNVYYATDPEWDRKIADHYRTVASNL